jgi:hypothetical protein
MFCWMGEMIAVGEKAQSDADNIPARWYFCMFIFTEKLSDEMYQQGAWAGEHT